MTAPARSTALTGILLALGGSLVLSVNDLSIKYLSGDYALHQVILTRAAIGLCFLFALVAIMHARGGQGFGQFWTRRPLDHLIRVSFVMVSNVSYFLGLAVMPLADAVAVAYVSPLLVTLLSVVVLGEKVGPRRWAAVAVGMLGVVIMLRPGAGVVQPAALLVLLSAFCYASSHMMTRRMRETESAAALSFYVQIGFVTVSSTMGLTVGDGHLAREEGVLAFLFRPWIWPPMADWPAFLGAGLAVAIGGLMVSQAYRTNEAGLIAPFEYVGMPMAILWGILIFGTLPDATGWVGIALICGAGLYVLWRETVRKQERRVETSGSGL